MRERSRLRGISSGLGTSSRSLGAWRLVAALLAALFAGANLIAVRYSYVMTRFTRGEPPERRGPFGPIERLALGGRTARPENVRTPGDLGLRFETRSFKGAFGTPLEAWLLRKPGSKGLVLMFPGYAAAKDQLLPAAKELYELGYDALLVDFHGGGGSGGETTSVGYHEADDVAAAWSYARDILRARRPLLYGVSMGAAAVLRAVHVGGLEPAGLILEAPFDRMRKAIAVRVRLLGLPAAPVADLVLAWGALLGGFNSFAHDPVVYARSAKCPTLLLAGDADPFVSTADSRAVFDALGGPKDLVLLAGAGHDRLVEDRPRQWRSAVGRFLAR